MGTSSQRRRAQLKAVRPDIEAQECRGNVDTRLRKLAEGQVEAILLAAAGLDRLDKTEWIRQRLEPQLFCPAAGQGALGIETRKNDAVTMTAVAFLNHAATRFAVTVERAALAALGGGCQVPIGIHCRPALEDVLIDPSHQQNDLGAPSILRSSQNGWETSEPLPWEIFAIVAAPETGQAVRVHHRVPHAGVDPIALGRLMAQKLIDAGAGPLLAAAGGVR
jgi:hydroxymethylbilane synthase